MNNKKVTESDIDLWHKKLNSEKNAPSMGYRRNVVVYKLVCHVNNIIGCYLSNNFKPIPIFIERARIHIEENAKETKWREYHKMVLSYLRDIELYLIQNNLSNQT